MDYGTLTGIAGGWRGLRAYASARRVPVDLRAVIAA